MGKSHLRDLLICGHLRHLWTIPSAAWRELSLPTAYRPLQALPKKSPVGGVSDADNAHHHNTLCAGGS